MRVGAFTETGKVRQINEDSYYIPQDIENGIPLFVVADGMGGHNAGEIASSLAVELVVEYITNNYKYCTKDEHGITQMISEAILRANHIIYQKSLEDPELSGMGTTLTVIVIEDDKVCIGHVGDSRLYALKKNKLFQLTRDHSYVEQLIKNGTITREEAVNHPQKNVITRALGTEELVEIDISVRHFYEGDKLILCTDGLTNLVSDQQILEVVKENDSCQNAAEILVSMANELGGTDNITAIVIAK